MHILGIGDYERLDGSNAIVKRNAKQCKEQDEIKYAPWSEHAATQAMARKKVELSWNCARYNKC